MEWQSIGKSKPEPCEMVLCAGGGGGYFVGYWRHNDVFYVPNYRGGYRKAVAWTRFDAYEAEDGR